MTKQPEQRPAEAAAEHGEVMIDGPDGMVGSLTPEAALGTARVLHAAAIEAERQCAERNVPSGTGETDDESIGETHDRAK